MPDSRPHLNVNVNAHAIRSSIAHPNSHSHSQSPAHAHATGRAHDRVLGVGLVGHTRRSSTSTSPTAETSRRRQSATMRDVSPPPRPTPSGRMALSALVNSPPRSPMTTTEPLASSSSRRLSALSTEDPPPPLTSAPLHSGRANGSTSTSSSGWPQTATYDVPSSSRRVSASASASTSRSPTKPIAAPLLSHSPQVPLAPSTATGATAVAAAAASGEGVGPRSPFWQTNGHRSREPTASSLGPGMGEWIKCFRLDDKLSGTEVIWQEALGLYQDQRESEAGMMAELVDANPAALHPSPRRRPSPSRADSADPSTLGGPSKPTEPPTKKRSGWPADHPSRVAQREKKEAAIAAGTAPPPKRRSHKRKPQPRPSAALEDELLGLAEGDAASSRAGEDDSDSDLEIPARPPKKTKGKDRETPRDTGSILGESDDDVKPGLQEDEEGIGIRFDPDAIVQPSGLTRAAVIAKVQANDMRGLTEDDVKTVQDEMWMRKKVRLGGSAGIRKDGTIRKKPGPAKGWKKLRRGEEGASDHDSSAAEGPDGPEADIAALLEGDDDNRSRRRDGDDDEDDRRASLDAALEGLIQPEGKSRRGAKAREPGVGKGRWTRPIKAEKELTKKAEELAIQQVQDRLEEEDINAPNGVTDAAVAVVEHAQATVVTANTEDPRGVSEAEAKIRLGLVEDLQKQAWASIVRDVPRMYRVYQSAATVLSTNSARASQACYRNYVSQRALKPTYKSSARLTKEQATKAKRIMKELSLYWRKNEKDELAARKKAEKEALERAKQEEEAREAKRQARKLNFLLTQTELYSHFIGKKVKTAEAEDVGGDFEAAPKDNEGNEDLGLDESGEPLPDIDYDDDDEENLRRHAARGAHAAVKAAKDKARAFDQAKGNKPEEAPLDLDGDELNFQNPTLASDFAPLTQPKMLMAQLKEYQLKGLTWLGNLYEQGINGILADEMGLGKTIQSISLLAYLAEVHNLWGPFLVIAPSSTLHNWQQELARFVPRLKALPYWGSPKDRETLRKIWSRKNMTFDESSPFHILVTSYQLAVQDEKYFQGMKWQYMILDEAQAIKSSSSARWKSLLSLHCRNRLLLTGTPIQNSMHELWALLHFIMPSLFDSHEEFSEWFSKDIENAAGSGGATLKPEQLRRLHVILKPFMLRRIKKHVQKELGDKIEIDLLVDLSQRQRSIYKALRQRVSISDLLAQAQNMSESSTGLAAKNLMNLVMQFRKVCNHPDLFERADVVSPYMFGTFPQSGNLAREVEPLYCPDSAKNAIEVQLPRLVWEEGKLDLPSEDNMAAGETHVLQNLMSIWNEEWVARRIKEEGEGYGFLRVMGCGAGEAARRAREHPLVSLLEDSQGVKTQAQTAGYASDPTFAASETRIFRPLPARVPTTRRAGLTPLRDITQQSWNISYFSRRSARFALEKAVVPPIRPVISSRAFLNTQQRLSSDPLVHAAIYGLPPSQISSPAAVAQLDSLVPGVPPTGLLRSSPPEQAPFPGMKIPAFQRLIVDSAKLKRLDELLRELKDGGHRVLLYFQMTRMMDLAEEYLIYRQYKYLRLDGGSPIGERRDMVTSWQTNPDIFVFCLSTRAGGLGINLTAADTVIFYDHDWNPSNDAQAMDRAHRVGQTKQVTVYRLIARGTIEERIINMARGKKDVQDIVVGAKSLTDVAKPAEIVSLFMDDEELAESVAKRKQAEAHGYTAPSINAQTKKSAFGDGLGGDDDEDDFFSLARKPANNEDEDFGDENKSGGNASGTATPKGPPGARKRKAEGEVKRSHKKKVKIALGPDGLPL